MNNEFTKWAINAAKLGGVLFFESCNRRQRRAREGTHAGFAKAAFLERVTKRGQTAYCQRT